MEGGRGSGRDRADERTRRRDSNDGRSECAGIGELPLRLHNRIQCEQPAGVHGEVSEDSGIRAGRLQRDVSSLRTD